MEYLVTAEEMKRFDKNTSEYFKIPSIVLMERAALSCMEVITDRQNRLKEALEGSGMEPGRRVLVVAGCGNNGGDGFALGRLLMQEGYSVDFVLAGDEKKATEQTALQLECLRAYGGKIMGTLPDGEYDIIIDALFGVGLTREVGGFYRECVEYINGQNAYVLSVDIPSGIHADSGAVMGAAVYADVTVTFGFLKLGTFLYPGARHAGQVRCFPIGITQDSFLDDPPKMFTFTEPVYELMPGRISEGNKGTFGKAALLVGSEKMAGAAILCAGGAFAAGCGMVKVISPAKNWFVLNQTLPEAMVTDDVREAAGWADVIAAGPGLTTGERAKEQLTFIIEETDCPLILDADAINLLSQDRALLESLQKKQQDEKTRRQLVLTPHPAELARLAGCSIKEVVADPVRVIREWAKRLYAVVLCKGARTFVASFEDGIYVNGSGNSGMATAGSGDVLTGIVAALAACERAQNNAPGGTLFLTVCVGVYLHGLAGDKAAHIKSEYSMKAGDIVDMVPQLLRI